MATVTAYTAFNMSNQATSYAAYTISSSSSSIVLTDGYRYLYYTGSSFGYANDGTVISGTMTGYSQTLGVLPSYE